MGLQLGTRLVLEEESVPLKDVLGEEASGLDGNRRQHVEYIMGICVCG